jgi:HK97 family phage prohead protease
VNTLIEHRALGQLELRAAPAGSGFIATLVGVAAPFNRDSQPFKGEKRDWVERIAPGAFTRTLRENPDVVGLWSHDANKPIARCPNTLQLREDPAAGLRFTMQLGNTSLARDLAEQVRTGVVKGVSFAFTAVKTRWAERGQIDVRTLIDVNLFEISPTVWPAYTDSTVAERSLRAFHELRCERPELHEVMQERDRFLVENRTPLRDYWALRLGVSVKG